jgi:predicted nucleotidyltransferase component of viral defense system
MPQRIRIEHFYPNIPRFDMPCLSQAEMIAEKMAAAIGRNKPRDHYDLFMIIKKRFEIDMNLVKRKCEQSGIDFSIIRIFSHAKKLKNRWNEDMIALLAEQVTFEEVMTTLAKYFRQKEAKEKE